MILHRRIPSVQELKELHQGKPYEKTYEIEICHVTPTLPVLCEEHKKTNRNLSVANLHIHNGSKDLKPYVCYPPQIMAAADAIKIAEQWAVGTIFQIITGCDINWLCNTISYYKVNSNAKADGKTPFTIASDAIKQWFNMEIKVL
ncbi:MAG: hypothetical protein WCJ81_02965 [bacterium]